MFSIFRDADQMEAAEEQLIAMLAMCQDTFDLAAGAVFGEADVKESGDQLGLIDHDLNKTERAVRREMLVHGTVRGAEVDHGLMMAYMAVAKDIERIGDYCKNIWNLAQMGVDLSIGDDREELMSHRKRVAYLLRESLEAFRNQDTARVHELIEGIDQDTSHYDSHVVEFVNSDLPGRQAAPRALFYRYLKRISAHLSNLLTSVVMPVDRIDFYKKSKAVDRVDD
jgi:phosphate uptake regulator